MTQHSSSDSSNLITAEGHAALSEELRYLWKVKRPEVTQAVSEAAALGDRSENAEYIYGKKQLREIDRRLRFLAKRLEAVTVVTTRPADLDKVSFGAWVLLETEQGKQTCFRLVGTDEANPDHHKLSINSPLACALNGKQCGDEINLSLPESEVRYYLLEISYTENICKRLE